RPVGRPGALATCTRCQRVRFSNVSFLSLSRRACNATTSSVRSISCSAEYACMSRILTSSSSMGLSNGSGMQRLPVGFARTVRQSFEDAGDPELEFLALDDVIDHALLQQELGALEPLGQVLLDGLLYHP